MNQRYFGGKRDSRHHSTTDFSENVEVAVISHPMLDIRLPDSGEDSTAFKQITFVNFSGEKKQIK